LIHAANARAQYFGGRRCGLLSLLGKLVRSQEQTEGQEEYTNNRAAHKGSPGFDFTCDSTIGGSSENGPDTVREIASEL
jgi:hypothetical protein